MNDLVDRVAAALDEVLSSHCGCVCVPHELNELAVAAIKTINPALLAGDVALPVMADGK